jgi:hypothetical protein
MSNPLYVSRLKREWRIVVAIANRSQKVGKEEKEEKRGADQ